MKTLLELIDEEIGLCAWRLAEKHPQRGWDGLENDMVDALRRAIAERLVRECEREAETVAMFACEKRHGRFQ